MMQHEGFTRRRFTALCGMLAISAVALSGCGGPGNGTVNADFGFATAEQDASGTITVWVDASREPLAKAFKDAHPDVKVNVETYDGGSGGSGTFQSRIALYDQAGEGWPDVVFSTQQNDTAWASKETNGVQGFAAPLNKGYLDTDFLNGFTEGALAPMSAKGDVYGLRNDLAPVVLWYNKVLFEQFGYTVPTSWEEYKDLSDKVAKEHPGYILGALGDSFQAPNVYYWGGEAPIFQVDDQTFSANFSDKKSKQVTGLLDHMLANKTMTTESVFAAEFATKYKDKLLAIPGPTWYAGALFQNPESLNFEAGVIGAAAPLTWQNGAKVTGNVGGGVWYASSHSKNLAAAKTFLEFVTKSDEAVKLNSGLPAYKQAADAWLKKQAESKFYAGDFSGSLSTAAGSVWQGWGYPSFSTETAAAKIVIPAITAGGSVSSVAEQWETEIKSEAQVQGYTVK